MQRTLPSLECIDTLSVLCLASLHLGEVPAAVQNLCHLTELSLAYNSLTSIPAGPYLARLKELDLSGNRFGAVPLEVCGAAATLETLTMDGCDDMTVQLAAPDKLRCMQCLRIFSLARGHQLSSSVTWSRTSLKTIVQLGRALPHTRFHF